MDDETLARIARDAEIAHVRAESRYQAMAMQAWGELDTESKARRVAAIRAVRAALAKEDEATYDVFRALRACLANAYHDSTTYQDAVLALSADPPTLIPSDVELAGIAAYHDIAAIERVCVLAYEIDGEVVLERLRREARAKRNDTDDLG